MKKILILAGPSAVGKTTVADYILKTNTDFSLVRSATTRTKRGDGHDAEYIYLSKEEFCARILSGKMLEHTEYANEMYGTPASEIEKIFDEGKIPLLILDLNGVRSLKGAALGYGVFSVYLTSEESVLNERLYERARAEGLTKTALNKFERRKEQNRLDKETVKSTPNLFDAVIENTTVEKTAEDIISKFLK